MVNIPNHTIKYYTIPWHTILYHTILSEWRDSNRVDLNGAKKWIPRRWQMPLRWDGREYIEHNCCDAWLHFPVVSFFSSTLWNLVDVDILRPRPSWTCTPRGTRRGWAGYCRPFGLPTCSKEYRRLGTASCSYVIIGSDQNIKSLILKYSVGMISAGFSEWEP